jgi:hypothetical protein
MHGVRGFSSYGKIAQQRKVTRNVTLTTRQDMIHWDE